MSSKNSPHVTLVLLHIVTSIYYLACVLHTSAHQQTFLSALQSPIPATLKQT